MYQKTITLFNRSGSRWIPTVLHNVDLNIDRAVIVSRYGADSNDRAILHVRCNIDDGNVYIEGKPWVTPAQYRNTAGALTFTSGEEFDFFIEGEYGDGSAISDDAFGIDGFYDYMNRQYDCYAITSVSGPYSLLPHFEVTAR